MRLHRFLDPLLFSLARKSRRPGAARGVLFISAGGLGDTVLLSRVFERFLPVAKPGEPVTVLLRADAMAMAFLFPSWVSVESVDYSRLRDAFYRLRIFTKLFAANYRLVVATDYMRHPDLDEALVMATGSDAVGMAARPSTKHGSRLRGIEQRYSWIFETGPPLQDKVLRWKTFAQGLTGIDAGPVRLAGAVPPQPEAPRPCPGPYAVIQPFSAVTLKQPRPEMWLRVIEALPPHWQVLVAGHPKDLDRNPDYEVLFEHPRVRFEGAPFRVLASILRQSSLVVSVDTACLHLAVIMGAPTLCLASSAFVGEIMPYAPEIAPATFSAIHASCPQQGCLGKCFYPPRGGMYPCIANLDPDAVTAAVMRAASHV